MSCKLINLGKGESGKGMNSKLGLTMPHPTLPFLGHSLTFWATVTVEFKEKELTYEQAKELLSQLKDKTNEKGTFKVWQP